MGGADLLAADSSNVGGAGLLAAGSSNVGGADLLAADSNTMWLVLYCKKWMLQVGGASMMLAAKWEDYILIWLQN